MDDTVWFLPKFGIEQTNTQESAPAIEPQRSAWVEQTLKDLNEKYDPQ
jgi:hypothetical protein